MQKWKEIPFVSATLVAINVIVFMICTFTGNLLYNMGELGAEHIVFRGEYGRLIFSMFLHGDIHHILNNMVILFFLGKMIEAEVGHLRYALFYFLSGIGGNILSLMWKLLTADSACSIGASGAVFGLEGVLLAMVLFAGRRMPTVTPFRVLLMIGYSLYSGFTGENIDNAAHVGGLVTGFLLGIIMCIFDKIRKNKNGSERCSIEY